jgi:ankyrin repeat protein
MRASSRGHTAIVQLLLDHGAQVDVHDSEGDTELMHASYRGHTAIVQILLDCGALVYIQNVSDRILTQ